MSKTILSIGAGLPQLDFVKKLKQRNLKVISVGKGRNSPEVIRLSDEFHELDTHNSKEIINWIITNHKQIDAVGSFAGGKAIDTLQKICKKLQVSTRIPSSLMTGMDKFSQQKLYNEFNLSSIKSWNAFEIKENPTLLDNLDAFIIKPIVGRGSSGVLFVNKAILLGKLCNNQIDDETIIQEYRGGIEYRTLVLVKDKHIKLLAPIIRESLYDTFLLGRLKYSGKDYARLSRYFSDFIKRSGLQDVILKADVLVSSENIDMIEMDIGVGGGIYFKNYISELYDYDLIDEYINLILGEEVSVAQTPESLLILDYIYNYTGKPVDLRLDAISAKLMPIIGNHKLTKNLLSPEKNSGFKTNADFLFTVSHTYNDVQNKELNELVNRDLFL